MSARNQEMRPYTAPQVRAAQTTVSKLDAV